MPLGIFWDDDVEYGLVARVRPVEAKSAVRLDSWLEMNEHSFKPEDLEPWKDLCKDGKAPESAEVMLIDTDANKLHFMHRASGLLWDFDHDWFVGVSKEALINAAVDFHRLNHAKCKQCPGCEQDLIAKLDENGEYGFGYNFNSKCYEDWCQFKILDTEQVLSRPFNYELTD